MHGGQPRPAGSGQTATAQDEYGFLLDGAVDAPTLARACEMAGQWGTTPHDVLLSTGQLSQNAYYRALAESCGAAFLTEDEAATLTPAAPESGVRACLRTGLLRQSARGKARFVLAGAAMRPGKLKNALTGPIRSRVSIGTPRALREALMRAFADRLMNEARNGLAARFPAESAAGRTTRMQRLLAAVLFSLGIVFAVIAPVEMLRTLGGIATLFFALVVALRIAACINLALTAPLDLSRRAPARIPDRNLPVYTVLVPLFREHRVLPALARALLRLDYPAAKLDIKLIFESVDTETLRIAKELKLPGCFDFIVVPDAQPRTKPKALNYALQFARGEFVAIYDAEDRPDPGQLRAALAAFRAGPPNLACLQARLNFYNARENWLTRGIR